MRFEVLGTLRVVDRGASPSLGPPQQQKLLALLLASRNRVVSTDRLIDEIWQEDPPPSAPHLIEVYASRLRHVLGDSDGSPRIVHEGAGYKISTGPGEVDAEDLATAIGQARELLDERPDAAERLLAGVCPDGSTRPFGDLADESFDLQAEGHRLEELMLLGVEMRSEAQLALGADAEVAAELDPFVAAHPYRERLWGLRMLALYRAGRQAEALETARRLRTTLAEDLGIDPSPEIRDLEQQILVQDPGLLWEPPPPPCNLPEPPTSFVGRRWELAEVTKLVDTHRLVTLTGPGGIGKTRLAIEAAEALLPRFSDGVWWVDLAAASDSRQVTASLARVLGVTTSPRPSTDAVVGSVAHRRALIVLDNCEHVARAAADLVLSVLEGTRDVRVLATSRSPLGAAGEIAWAVPSLSMPNSNEDWRTDLMLSDAVRLLVERATSADRSFVLSGANAPAVVDLCRRLDALPLAIEMAAARLRSHSPGQIAAALDTGFDLLAGSEDPDPRHGTLQAACAWSYGLLDPGVRPVFDRLAVFVGPFDFEAAAAVGCPDADETTAMDAVTRLVDASMLDTDRRGDRVWYRMLQTFRWFGIRHLEDGGELEQVCETHARYLLGIAVAAGDHLVTPEFAPWSHRMTDLGDDLHRALDWSLAHHSRTETLRAAPALFYHWYRTGMVRQAEHWSDVMLDGADDAPDDLRAWAHLSRAFAANLLGDPETLGRHSGEAVRLLEARDPTAEVMSLYARAHWCFEVWDLEGMAECCRRALEICDEHRLRWDRAGPLSMLAISVLFGGESLEDAQRLLEAALPLHRALGHIAGMTVINPLSQVLRHRGDLAGAERAANEACAWGAGTGWEAQTLEFLAEVQMARGDLVAARSNFRLAVRRAVEAGLDSWFRVGLLHLALLAARDGDAVLAARLSGASRRNLPEWGNDPAVYGEIEGVVTAALGAEAAARLESDGYEMSGVEALGLVEPSAG